MYIYTVKYQFHTDIPILWQFTTCDKTILGACCCCVFVLVEGRISTAAMKAYFTLTPMEFRHSSPEGLHTKRRERDLC
jgi:hypothetical protein